VVPRRGRIHAGATPQQYPETAALAPVSRTLAPVRALTFDTYGTVVDWRTSVLAELQSLADRKALRLDCVRFLDDWKAAYRPAMDKVNRGEIPWTTVDAIYRTRLEELIVTHGIRGLAREEIDALSRVWWRLRPWPHSLAAIHRLHPPSLVTPPSTPTS